MTTKNPFPGMNPFFEQQWRDAHATLITYLGDALQERLPADLVARTEEEVVAIGAAEMAMSYRPDVQVREPWTLKEPATAPTSATEWWMLDGPESRTVDELKDGQAGRSPTWLGVPTSSPCRYHRTYRIVSRSDGCSVMALCTGLHP